VNAEPLVDPTPGELDKAIEDNWYGWLPLFERFDGGSVERKDGYVRWLSLIPMPFFNGICGVPASGDLDAGIDDALAPFDARGIPLLWIVPPPADIDDRLTARGFAVEHTPGMAIELAALRPAERPVGASLVEVKDDPDEIEACVRVTEVANEMPDESTPPILRAIARLPERDHIRAFMATVDGEPAASAVLLEWAGVAGLYNVGTLPEYRGRGLGTYVSLAALEAGRPDGYRHGVLQASAMGEALYRSMGFEVRSRFTFAVREG
jgi:GNAT superfamily N-acetyltransferase